MVPTPWIDVDIAGACCACCACREELCEGHTVNIMPCKHVFHPPCLAPWLAEHNSCPICRCVCAGGRAFIGGGGGISAGVLVPALFSGFCHIP
jgi:hypothetical protein